MDRRRLLFRLAGLGWLVSLALVLWSGQSSSMFGFYGTSILPLLIPLELLLAVLVGLWRRWWAAMATMVAGPLLVVMGYEVARSYDTPGSPAIGLYLALLLPPLVATLLSLAAGMWPSGNPSSNRPRDAI